MRAMFFFEKEFSINFRMQHDRWPPNPRPKSVRPPIGDQHPEDTYNQKLQGHVLPYYKILEHNK